MNCFPWPPHYNLVHGCCCNDLIIICWKEGKQDLSGQHMSHYWYSSRKKMRHTIIILGYWLGILWPNISVSFCNRFYYSLPCSWVKSDIVISSNLEISGLAWVCNKRLSEEIQHSHCHFPSPSRLLVSRVNKIKTSSLKIGTFRAQLTQSLIHFDGPLTINVLFTSYIIIQKFISWPED